MQELKLYEALFLCIGWMDECSQTSYSLPLQCRAYDVTLYWPQQTLVSFDFASDATCTVRYAHASSAHTDILCSWSALLYQRCDNTLQYRLEEVRVALQKQIPLNHGRDSIRQTLNDVCCTVRCNTSLSESRSSTIIKSSWITNRYKCVWNHGVMWGPSASHSAI